PRDRLALPSLPQRTAAVTRRSARRCLPERSAMATDIRLKEELPEVTESLLATYAECKYINHLGHKPLPSREAIIDILTDLMDILYPGFWRRQNLHIGNVEYHVGDVIDGLHDKMTTQIARVLRHDCEQPEPGIDFERM